GSGVLLPTTTILENLPQNCLYFVRVPLEFSIRKVLSIEISLTIPLSSFLIEAISEKSSTYLYCTALSLSQLNYISGLGGLSQATKTDPEKELRFLLRQFNRRLRMDQLKEIIEIAKEDSQQATLKLMEELNNK
ncbi:MAG: hypothetical protein EZS28_029926, partial [Streblomastix strix]